MRGIVTGAPDGAAPLPAARLEQLLGGELGGRDPAQRLAEARGHAGDDLGVVEVRGRLDDRAGALLRIAGLEDPAADEDAVGAELHAERGVGRSGDAAGG